MIVSRKVAEDRIASGRNTLRPSGAPLPVEKESYSHEGTAEDSPVQGDARPSSEDTNKTGLSLDLSSLDKLLQHKGGYRGQLDNQVAIAETAPIIGRAGAGEIFGLGPSQIEAYDTGRRSINTDTERAANPELKRRVDTAKERIAELAVGRLGETLGYLTTDKLKGIKKATTLTKVGKDLAVIVDKVTPKKEADTGQHVHFHVYRPPTLDVSAYKKVEIGQRSEVFIDVPPPHTS